MKFLQSMAGRLVRLIVAASIVLSNICGSFAMGVREMFVVPDGEYIPLFTRGGTEFEYFCGTCGVSCECLDTVLPPGTFVKVLSMESDGTVHVFCRISGEVSIDGFVHSAFLSNLPAIADGVSFDAGPQRSVKNVGEICEILDSYIGLEIPYGWGCNMTNEIDLHGLYKFKCAGNECIVAVRIQMRWIRLFRIVACCLIVDTATFHRPAVQFT